MAKLMVLFSWSASRFAVPEHVVAPNKDWPIVKDAETERAARIARERRLREARQRIAERERELRLAREAYRRETSRIVQASSDSQLVSDADRKASEERLHLAQRRLSERERQAYEAKLEYGRTVRALREQRLEAEKAVGSDS